LTFPFIKENEFESVEICRQNQHVVDVALAQDTHEIIADLGRQRSGLGEHHPQELLVIFGKKLDSLDRSC
jgi:hypothetical protein